MKLSKVLSVFVIAIMLVASVSNVVLASGNLNPSNINANYEGTDGLKTIGGNIIGVIQTLGSVLSVIVLVILGVKYMMGSTEEKAEYKKTMIPYVVGAVLIFAASNIAGFVFTWADAVGNTTIQ